MQFPPFPLANFRIQSLEQRFGRFSVAFYKMAGRQWLNNLQALLLAERPHTLQGPLQERAPRMPRCGGYFQVVVELQKILFSSFSRFVLQSGGRNLSGATSPHLSAGENPPSPLLRDKTRQEIHRRVHGPE